MKQVYAINASLYVHTYIIEKNQCKNHTSSTLVSLNVNL